VVSLTTTPMMCARFLKSRRGEAHGRLYRASERAFERLLGAYEVGLAWVLRHPRLTMLVALITVCINVYLYVIVPKGFFPEQDNGRLMGAVQADQDTSFQSMRQKLAEFVAIVRSDPAVDTVVALTGGSQGSTNAARMFMALKPIDERKLTAAEVMARLRPKLATVPGASLYLQAVQDIRVGGRLSNALFQFTLQGDDLRELNRWGRACSASSRNSPPWSTSAAMRRTAAWRPRS